MIEALVVLLVLGAATIVFYPVLAGRADTGRAGPGAGPAPGPQAAARAELVESKARLLRNLKELDADRAAGRVGQEAYEALRRRDQEAAARLLQQLDALDREPRSARRTGRTAAPTPAAPGARSRRVTRAVAWVGGVAGFALLLAFTMSQSIAPRAPGGSITGTVPGGGGSGGGGMLPTANPQRLAQVERTLRGDSGNVPALLEAGHLYLAEQRFDEAAQVTVRALELNRQAPEAYAHLAVLLMAEASSHEDPDSARTSLNGAIQAVDEALRLKPDLAEGWLFKGMIYMAGLRDPQSAAQAWEQYLKVAPPDADTSRIAAMVRGVRGR